ncbi:acetylornithine deacetylase [Microbaculum marinum]|uniref:Acetylornithine deacetylase n=1 Tax=Microbaculum marinum TaxID=1764581 RepID=A0AAW9RG08_9HYPH
MAGDTLDFLDRLVGFDTVSSKSNLDLIDWVGDLVAAKGARLRRTYNDERTKANLLVSIGPVDVPGLLLSGHSDVVLVDDQQWSTDPFRLTEKHGSVFGRGTADMKGFVACCLSMLTRLDPATLRRPVHLALSYDEELGCRGVPRLVDDLVASTALPAVAVVGEPTLMQVATCHKGARVYETVFTGLEAHSSQSQIGVSANVHAARFILHLERIFGELATRRSGARGLVPDTCTFNAGVMSGGTAVNMIPRSSRLLWEFRDIPEVDGDLLEETLLAHLFGPATDAMRMGCAGARIDTERLACVLPLDPAGTGPAVELVRRLTGISGDGAVAFGTEAGNFQNAGIPAVVCGPGTIAVAHKPDEHVALSQLAAADRFLDDLAAWIT